MQDDSDTIPDRPFLCIYEEQEHFARYRRGVWYPIQPIQVTIDAPENQNPDDDADMFRKYHVWRFFDSIAGFNSGSLDLLGRHKPRLESLILRFTDIKVDFETIGTKDGLRDRSESERWRDFRLKRKIPRVISFEEFRDRMAGATDMIRRNDFKIQRLHLQDLPDELIDMIFGYLPPRDARDLASTSGRLRNVGLAYAYTSQSLIFPSFIEYRETDVRGSRTFRRKPEKDFVDRCKHLSSRPECVSGLQRLKFGLHFSEDDAFSFFPASISHCIQEVLRNCSNLTTLTIQRLNLSEDWIEVISSMRQLHTMVLEFHCFIGREIAQKVVRDEVPTLAQIRNLTIKWGHDDDIEVAWWILSLFPFLITFNHLKNPDRGRSILLPAPPLQHWRPLFSTLRHLLISDLDPSELPSLWEWMVCAVTHLEGVENSSRLDSLHIPLTHLKLDFIVPIRDSEVINFLIMLGNLATLQVLALNGIEDGSLALVTRIAKIFPDLKGLTLFRSGVAQDSFAGDWPSYTWEYASIFSRFNRLEYFGWNYNVNSFIYPKSLLMFEADNPEECYGRDFWQDEDWHFECTEALARMFAAFCPTFRMLAMHYDETDNAEYYAVRRNGLQIRNEERYSESEWRRDRWDPHSVFSGWESDGK